MGKTGEELGTVGEQLTEAATKFTLKDPLTVRFEEWLRDHPGGTIEEFQASEK